MKKLFILGLMGLMIVAACTKTVEKIITPETVGSILGKVTQKDSEAWVVISQVAPVDSVQINPEDGSFLLENVLIGNYDLTVKSENYGTYQKFNVEVTGGALIYVGEIRLSNWPDFVSAIYPEEQSEIIFDRRWTRLIISVQFTKPMDRESIETAFATNPPSEGVFYWNTFQYAPTPRYYLADAASGAEITTYEKINSFTYRMAQKDGYVDTTYTVTLSTTATDTSGNPIPFPLQFSFSTIQSATSQNVILTEPEHGAIYVNPLQNASIYVTFPRRMDAASTEAALSITPQFNITPLWPEMNQLRIFTGGPLKCETVYSIRIDSTAKDLDGIALGEPFEFSFETAPLEITNTRPVNGEIFVSRNVAIGVQFNTYVSLAVVQNAITIDPPVSGTFFRGWENQTTPSKEVVSFRPTQNLRKDTKYTVTIGTEAADMYGTRLKEPVTISFVTESD